MSSILKALKKAEQESTPERGAATQWSARLPEPSPYQRRRRRWWLPLGIVVIGCVCAVFFWQVIRHDPPPPARSITPATPISDNTPSPAPKEPAVKLPLYQKKAAPPAAAPKQAVVETSASVAGSSAPAVTAAPVQPTEEVPPASSPPSPALTEPQQKVAGRTATLVDAPAKTPPSPSMAAAEPPPRPAPVDVPSPEQDNKNYRSDQRIELQALVWAPEVAARFVVINDRLIKEGGSIDKITVVRINRDDVLLSEGSDRWYEKFKIR